jgi:predicted DNA-binding transcriptional regulator YafY
VHPLERLLNLVALLLNARRPLTFDDIREQIPAYGQDDPAAAKRMFERDKDTLREVGIPVELAPTDVWDVEKGYRIPRERYYLPDIELTPDETWALFVAAHMPGDDTEAESAFQKLSAGSEGGVLAAAAGRAPAPGVDVSGPHLGAVAEALARRRAIRFRYRPLSGQAGPRDVDPFGLVFRAGHWYLVGQDRERRDIRVYRLSRMTSRVREIDDAVDAPEGFSAVRHVEAGPWGLGRPAATARVGFSPKVAWLASATPGARVVRTRPDGWVEVEVPASHTDTFVSWVLSFGADARVSSPRPIRDQVVERLRALAAGAPATPTGGADG